MCILSKVNMRCGDNNSYETVERNGKTLRSCKQVFRCFVSAGDGDAWLKSFSGSAEMYRAELPCSDERSLSCVVGLNSHCPWSCDGLPNQMSLPLPLLTCVC